MALADCPEQEVAIWVEAGDRAYVYDIKSYKKTPDNICLVFFCAF